MNKEFTNFLKNAKKAGYAAGGESVVSHEADGSKSTRYNEGRYSFHDNYFGGEPFGGREVVHLDGKPYWMMVYYGSDDGVAKDTINVLLEVLSTPPAELPVRGPRTLRNGNYEYKNTWNGDLSDFSGEETILYQNKEVYKAQYVGGLVDQREG